MTRCDPNNLACAKRAGVPGPDFCGECGLARADFAPGASYSAPPPKSATNINPPPPRSSRPVLQMKPPSPSVPPSVSSQPQAIPQTQAAPTPTTQPNPQPVSPSSRSNPAISRLLLSAAQQAPKTPPPPQPPVVSPQSLAATPSSPRQRRWRRPKALIGLLLVAAVIAAASVIVIQTDVIERFTNTASPTTRVVGTVSDELMALARDSSPEVRLGSKSVTVSDDGFSTVGAAEHTGLATLVVGDDILGSNLMPKSDSLIISSLQVSLESTALSMVLLRPEIADVYVVGNPILDAAAQELLLQSAELQAVVDALRAEKDLEGVAYLREISPETQSRLGLAADWFRQRVSNGEAKPVNLAARPNREANTNHRETELRVTGLPQTCDEGLMPSSGGEADGLCFEVISPKRTDWDKYTFDEEMEVAVKNLSPRAVALFLESDGSDRTFLGLVPPLDLTLPSAGEVLFSVLKGTTRYFQLAPDYDRTADNETTSTFRLSGATETSELMTVTFDFPGAPGIANPEFDQLVEASDLKTGRAIAVGLTALSAYLLPMFGVLLDSKKWTTKKTNSGFLSECPATVITDFSESATELFLNADTSGSGSETLFDLLMNSEGVIPDLFWLSLADLMGQNCESAISDTKVITACFPTLQSFLETLRSPSSSSVQLDQCGGKIFDRLLKELSLGVLKGLVNPLAKVDTGIVLLGSLRAAAWSLRDAKRFADGDQYELSTIRIPRWCYEVAASRTRMFGVFNEFNIEQSGNLIKDFREITQGFLTLTTQLVEVGGNISNEANWEREAKAWSEIAAIGPPDVQPAAQRTADISARISEITPDIKDAAQLAAKLALTESAAQRAIDGAQLALKLRGIQDNLKGLLGEIEEGQQDFERFDSAWRNTCPQSTVDS